MVSELKILPKRFNYNTKSQNLRSDAYKRTKQQIDTYLESTGLSILTWHELTRPHSGGIRTEFCNPKIG